MATKKTPAPKKTTPAPKKPAAARSGTKSQGDGGGKGGADMVRQGPPK